jgi:hypothetical protein
MVELTLQPVPGQQSRQVVVLLVLPLPWLLVAQQQREQQVEVLLQAEARLARLLPWLQAA